MTVPRPPSKAPSAAGRFPRLAAATWRRIASRCGRLLRARGLWILLGAFAVETMLERIGAIRPIDSYVFDSMLWLQKAKLSQRIVLVTIDDADYREHFHRRSPLDATKIFQAVEIIAGGRPRVIGVDLDTSDPSFSEPADLPENVVWARGAEAVELNPVTASEYDVPGAVECAAFLGGTAYQTQRDAEGRISTKPASGVALACVDRDGVVRRYARWYHGFDVGANDLRADNPLDGILDSFAWQIVSEYRRRGGEEAIAETTKPRSQHHQEEPAVIHFSLERQRFQRVRFSTLLEEAKRPDWSWAPVFQDKIVLLGAVYRAARDQHVTPVGLRYGIEVSAEAIDTECEGRNIRHAGHFVVLGLHLLPALLIWWLHRLWPSPASIVVSIPLIFLSVGISFLVFQSFAYFLNFAIVPVGMWIHVLIESVQVSHHPTSVQQGPKACRNPRL